VPLAKIRVERVTVQFNDFEVGDPGQPEETILSHQQIRSETHTDVVGGSGYESCGEGCGEPTSQGVESLDLLGNLAEGEGFEPPVGSHPQQFSSSLLSAI